MHRAFLSDKSVKTLPAGAPLPATAPPANPPDAAAPDAEGATARLRINRTEREQGGRVTFRMERLRPNLPASEAEPSRRETPTEQRP